MDGGHYVTKGHISLDLHYIKTSPMSRNILEPALAHRKCGRCSSHSVFFLTQYRVWSPANFAALSIPSCRHDSFGFGGVDNEWVKH